VLVEFLVKTSFIAQFRDLVAVNANASLERKIPMGVFASRTTIRGSAACSTQLGRSAVSPPARMEDSKP
jgi:hypothetical protein